MYITILSFKCTLDHCETSFQEPVIWHCLRTSTNSLKEDYQNVYSILILF